MPSITIVKEGDEKLKKEFEGKKTIHLGNDSPPIHIMGLKKGMASGKASVMFVFEIDDDTIVAAETSLTLLVSATDVLKTMFEGQY
jgi:hypothetical protein